MRGFVSVQRLQEKTLGVPGGGCGKQCVPFTFERVRVYRLHLSVRQSDAD
jgi:hypothetical protein